MKNKVEPEAGIGPATYALRVRSVDMYTAVYEQNILINKGMMT
ncbi:MAG: hypothetical protein ACKO1E_09195 [Acidimicrobiaceae bacterium]